MTISIYQYDVEDDDDDDRDEYNVHFFGDNIFTLVTTCPREVANWVSTIEYIHSRRRRRLIVGLDFEWRPNNRFHKNPVATLQLCVGRRCLIFQLLYCDQNDFPQELLEFLSYPNYTFVGVCIKRDIRKLEEDYDIEVGGRIFELRALAAEVYDDNSLKNASLKRLVNVVLGREIDKPVRVTRSRWDHRWLSLDQIQYACIDAYVSFEMGRVLNILRLWKAYF